MGVEMQVFLIPRTNSFRPDAEALASFVEKLRDGDWVCDPKKPWFQTMTFKTMRPHEHEHAKTTGAYVSTLADQIKRIKEGAGYSPFPQAEVSKWFADRNDIDLMIVWPVENQGTPAPLRYPLNKPSPASPHDTYYDVQIWLANDYVYQTDEVIDPYEDEHCACGAGLFYDPESENESLFHAPRMRTRCQACGKAFEPSERVAIVRNPWTNEESKVRGGVTFRFAVVIDCGKCWPRDESGFGVNEDLRMLCESHFGQPFYEVVDVY